MIMILTTCCALSFSLQADADAYEAVDGWKQKKYKFSGKHSGHTPKDYYDEGGSGGYSGYKRYKRHENSKGYQKCVYNYGPNNCDDLFAKLETLG